jgi:signal transduction histidine kinase/CheY-like chemotaxis protein/HPt (histidine-containing phosphotransfer) domain-containing protein
MRIQTRFILSVAGVLTASLIAAAWSWQHIQQDRLEADAARQTGDISALIRAARDYPGDPNRHGGIRSIAQAFTQKRPGYQIQEASDNPLNPADRPDALEASMLQRFRSQTHPEPINTFTHDPSGREWYVTASPVIATESCLECHSSAEKSAKAVAMNNASARRDQWQFGKVVAVQTVRLDLAELRAAQSQVNTKALIWGSELGLAALIGVYVFARRIVTKPLTHVGGQMQRIAEQRAYGDPLDESNRRDELGTCATAFNNLLGVVQKSFNELNETNANLERRVADRTAELARQSERAEAATRAKSEFLANMSHEIRTPLNGTIGAMQLLEASPLNDKQRKFAGTAKACANALLALINDILDFSKIEAGKLELVREAFNLRQIVDETITIFSPRASEKDLFLTCQFPSEISSGWWGDAARIRQILVNLIGNALKFTHTGGIEVRIDRLAQDDDFATLKVSVRDSGIGIPKDRLDRLFKSFSQVDASTTRQYGGTGLGLAITRQLADLMGGNVGVESTEGAGSTFWFTAKLQQAPETAIETIESATATGQLPQPGRILIIDDNDVNQMILSEMLKQAGHQVKIAGNGKEGLEHFGREAFDLIITDCQMPVMDGYEMTSIIRESESVSTDTPRIPIIALTSSALKGDGDRCIEAGMDDYATKPIEQNKLFSLIHRWMRPAAQNEAPTVSVEPIAEPATGVAAFAPSTESVPAQSPPAADAPPIEMQSLVTRCVGDEKFAYTMLDKFQQSLRESVVAIEQAFAASNADNTAKSAHKLKGSASYLSAEPIRYYAAEIETLSRTGSLDGVEESLANLRPQVQRCLDFIQQHLSPRPAEPEFDALEFADSA